MANKPLKSVQFPGLDDTYTIPQVDTTLAVTGAAADSKKVGDEITELKADFTQLDGKIAASLITNTASGAIASFPDGADGVPVKDLTVQIVPYQAGSGDPSPDNVRPISGWIGCNIYRTGVNIIDRDSVTYSTGKYINGSGNTSNSTNYKATGYIPVPENTKIVITGTGNNANTIRTAFYADKTVDSFISAVHQDTNVTTATTPSGARYMRVSVHNDATDPLCAYINEVSADTAYTGNTYTITFPTEAGTVYGGTLDVTSGVLTVDKASESFALSSVTPTIGTKYDAYSFALTNRGTGASSSTGKICNLLGAYLYAGDSAGEPHFYMNKTNAFIYLPHGTSNTLTAQFVFPLETPQTVQLTPQEVSTLLGLNNIWADTGDTTVDYRADTKLYIENLTAPTEDDMVANTNIPSDTYFMIGNTLFLSTTTIPAGDVINPGTNCTLMNLAAALNAINA